MARTKQTPFDERMAKEILSRLDRLEKVVLGGKKKRPPNKEKQDFSGPAGGVRLLVSQGFFKVKRQLGEVRKALGKDDYHYGPQQVHTALNRLSKRDGPLVASKEGGKKVYVNRK